MDGDTMTTTRRRYESIANDSARWDRYEPRPGDIIISTPPKCGTTWLQMICALLVFQTPELPAPLTEISPWVDLQAAKLDDVLASLDAQTHRRFIKGHVPLDGLPFCPEVTYIGVGRDPRDVALSWDDHLLNMKADVFINARIVSVGTEGLEQFMAEMEAPADTVVGRFRQWMEATPRIETMSTSLQGVLHHQRTFWEQRHDPNVVLLHYADLSADLEGQMRALADRLGIDVIEDRWRELVPAATFGEMKQRAAELAPESTIGLWQDPNRFFNRGESGAWRDVLTDDDLARYDERVAELVEPELAAWLHR